MRIVGSKSEMSGSVSGARRAATDSHRLCSSCSPSSTTSTTTLAMSASDKNRKRGAPLSCAECRRSVQSPLHLALTNPLTPLVAATSLKLRSVISVAAPFFLLTNGVADVPESFRAQAASKKAAPPYVPTVRLQVSLVPQCSSSAQHTGSLTTGRGNRCVVGVCMGKEARQYSLRIIQIRTCKYRSPAR